MTGAVKRDRWQLRMAGADKRDRWQLRMTGAKKWKQLIKSARWQLVAVRIK